MMRFINIILRSIALGCYYLSKVFPRKDNQWLFGSATGFNNNSKYFFIDVVENHPEIKAYWIGDGKNTALVRKLGYKSYTRFSLMGLWLCLTSKYYIVDHTQGCIDFWTSGGAKIVNLWHGVGWKACLWSEKKHILYKRKGVWSRFVHKLFYPHLYYKPDLLLSSSPWMTEHFFAPMFDVPKEKCVEDIYPRCKFILKSPESILNHIHKVGAGKTETLIKEMGSYDRIILYAPTYRDAQYDFIAESGIDFDDLNDLMVKNNWLFLVKFHPSTRIFSYQKIDHSNVILLDKNVDSNYMMPFTDVLVSDYSSIVFDYLLLEKSVILFPFDKDKYNQSSRDFAFEYEKIVLGLPVVLNYIGLKELLSHKKVYQIRDIRMIWDKKADLMNAIKELQ